jgi:hypothetical protein
MKTVSILTPSTDDRIITIKFVAKGICRQTYNNIIEWVIIDGTKTENSKLPELIKELRKMKGLPKIEFIPQDLNRNNKVGSLRNIAKNKTKGDIIVHFDDDDLYHEKRVAHAVNKLNESKLDLALCSPMFMYDADFNYVVKFRSFGPYHGVGCSMAYTKQYANKNNFGEDKFHAEESKFTNKFVNKAVQLDPFLSLVNSSHTGNTYSKKQILWDNFHFKEGDKNRSFRVYSTKLNFFCKNDKQYLKEYFQIMKLNLEQTHDIVYYCGLTNGKSWSPKDKSLGGSEQAVIQLSELWVKKGYKVAVYGCFEEDLILNGVEYIQYTKFLVSKQYNVLILWRLFGFAPILNCEKKFKTKKLVIDFHDREMFNNEDLVMYNIDRIDNFYLKSEFHQKFMESKIKEKTLKQDFRNKCIIIPNGIRRELFTNKNNIERSKYRFCYCSRYTRGLMNILKYMFPIIKANIPEAELHIYYGMEGEDKQFVIQMFQLMQQPGVFDHGRQSHEVICEEKYKSNMNLYYTTTSSEIDCITIKESAYTGCIPILSKYNLFNSRPGIHLPGDPDNPDDLRNVAVSIIKILMDDELIENIRNQVMNSDILYDWDDISDNWIKHLELK